MSANTVYLDPSKNATGWVVVHRSDVDLAMGVHIPKIPDRWDHYSEAEKRHWYAKDFTVFLDTVCSLYDIETIVSESARGSRSSKAAWDLSRCEAIICAYAKLKLFGSVTFIDQGLCKKAVTGNANATKKQIAAIMVRAYLNNPHTREHSEFNNRTELHAVTDALAVMYTHTHYRIKKVRK